MGIQIERYVLRYFRTFAAAPYVNIAVIVYAPAAGFCGMRVRDDWDFVRCFDPDADVPLLKALLQEMQESLSDPVERGHLLTDLKETLSNVLQSAAPKQYEIGTEPQIELERLARQVLNRRKVLKHGRGDQGGTLENKPEIGVPRLLEKRVVARWLM